MADRTVIITEPATNFDFLTLDEAKMLLTIQSTDTSQDELVKFLITTVSLTIAELCNRVFAQEGVDESWRDIGDRRMFMSHWPIKEIDGITQDGADVDTSLYEVEPDSGKISIFSGNGSGNGNGWRWSEPAVVSYTGGYVLPDEAPMPLKQATGILIREEKIRMQQAQTAGIRLVAHKESRVSFFDPNAVLLKLGGTSPSYNTVMALLKHYTRIEA
jgi:hypothetical protein